jgi:hypothetical protein
VRQRCCRYAGGGTFPGLTGSGGAGEDLPYHCSRPLDWLSRVGERPRGVAAVAAAAASPGRVSGGGGGGAAAAAAAAATGPEGRPPSHPSLGRVTAAPSPPSSPPLDAPLPQAPPRRTTPPPHPSLPSTSFPFLPLPPPLDVHPHLAPPPGGHPPHPPLPPGGPHPTPLWEGCWRLHSRHRLPPPWHASAARVAAAAVWVAWAVTDCQSCNRATPEAQIVIVSSV